MKELVRVSLKQEKKKFRKDDKHAYIFSILVTEYSQRIKTKEEIIKYTMRKCFKFVSEKIMKISSSNNKSSLTALCKRYFKNTKADPDMLLPFREKSKNKTMNSYFLEDLFSSEEFVADYMEFLEHLEEVLVDDNEKRIDNYLKYLQKYLKKDKIDGVEKFKRIPWPRIWLEKTKIISHELLSRRKVKGELVKKIKVSTPETETNLEANMDSTSTTSKVEEI